jgi:hypothetical protein
MEEWLTALFVSAIKITVMLMYLFSPLILFFGPLWFLSSLFSDCRSVDELMEEIKQKEGENIDGQ